ncbi:hypothetical protein ACIQBJ_14900 [Kitasatospora sp. NPDC088391]|uniref:hypothetical protein n=1 Tax=Kitasatospora sp. NPDC088391 TaxID=3364074 RepID=UPI0037FC593F
MVSAAEWAVVERLSGLPFPVAEVRPGPGGAEWGGPGYWVVALRESRDFWEDRGAEVVEPAEQEIEAARDALAAVLTSRWGAPRQVELAPYMFPEDPEEDVPEPLGYLAMVAVRLLCWPLPGAARWVGLAVGQADREFPFELLLAVGELSVLDGAAG